MLTFDRVTFQYPSEDFNILDELSFSLEPGEFVTLLGPSGCGKSTIFRLINGLLTPKSGSIQKPERCGYMPQQDLLFPWRTVEENVCLPLEIQGVSKAEARDRARNALKNVGLSGWEEKPPSALSGGMRQRAAFARTVLTGAELLLLDEPFSALDYLTRISMREWLLDQWRREEKTILFITHDVEEAVALSTRVLLTEQSPITGFHSIEVPADASDTQRLALKQQLIGRLRRAET